MIDLTKSRLFEESGIGIDEFEEVFGCSHIILPSEKEVKEIIITCDKFILDLIPLDDLFPLRHSIQKLKHKMSSPFLKLIIAAFFGSEKDVIETFEIQIIEWFYTHRKPKRLDPFKFLLESDCKDTQCILNIMELLLKMGIKPDHSILEIALRKKRQVAKWIWEHDVKLESFDIIIVLRSSTVFDPSFISEMIDGGCPISPLTVASAALSNHLDFVRWWHSKDYPFCTSAAAWVAIYGHTDVMQFLIDHKKPIDYDWTIRNAVQCKMHHIVKMLNKAKSK